MMEKEKKSREVDEDSDEIKKKELTKGDNKQLRNILIVIGIFLVLLFLWVFILDSIQNFEYRGVSYTIVKEQDLIFYQTSFPFYSGTTGKHIADYNIYIRNDPRKLKDISFDGQFNLKDNMVLNMTEEFNCDGDGVIAIANFAKTFEQFGTKVIKDQNASCDSQGRYMFIQIMGGNESKIEQYGPACYDLYINNCEILKVTEKFMIELFSRLNE